jgi:hypothetical protein
LEQARTIADRAETKKRQRSSKGQGGNPLPIAPLKAPFPYFGGKRRAAGMIWACLGDVRNYIEPCGGSAGNLLARPHPPQIETLNDVDCYIANFWRATQDLEGRYDLAEHMVATYADWPVNEVDLHARHWWLLFSDDAREFRERMRRDPFYYDPRIAGWWVWGMCTWIGSGWCRDPDDESEPVSEPTDKLPRLVGVRYGDLYYPGLGIHSQQAPQFLGDVAGIPGKRPKLSNGNSRFGAGVHRQPDPEILPEGRPQLADDYARGRGVHSNDQAETCRERREWLVTWFNRLRDRLRTVRVCCGDWRRVCGSKSVTTRLGLTGIYFDPPYSAESGRDPGLYGVDSGTVAHDVRAYCLERGSDPRMRIVLSGYAGEGHEILEQHGWTVRTWNNPGGYGNRTEEGKRRARLERVWCSPHCLQPS